MKNKMIAYALDFTSFLLENGIEPKRVILFGSVVTGEFDRESDIDVFIDTDKPEEKEIKNVLKVFEKTFGEKWGLKGISNPLSLKVGNLDKWRSLKRSMQSYGIILYGRYNELPENMKAYLLFRLDFGGMARARKVGMWRRLYGYAQKIGRKRYEKKGIIKSLGGKKLEKSVVVMPLDKSQKFKEFLNRGRIGFTVNEIWSDSL
ncbi:MAG: nucleotidyltransferase domain-containing protein [Candidatus Aenigmarchaeota archaeon]|nr:nucleotidyltransferase domain-containing protein [Candidatus Aenigmarchaeota archaeon]